MSVRYLETCLACSKHATNIWCYLCCDCLTHVCLPGSLDAPRAQSLVILSCLQPQGLVQYLAPLSTKNYLMKEWNFCLCVVLYSLHAGFKETEKNGTDFTLKIEKLRLATLIYPSLANQLSKQGEGSCGQHFSHQRIGSINPGLSPLLLGQEATIP